MSYVHILKDDDSAAMPIDLKYENRYKVLQAFRFGYECTVADVSSATHISKLTVMRAIQFFCQKGILRSVGLGQSSDLGGKKPEVFAFADSRRVLCIAMWPGTVRLSAATLTGEPVAETEHPLDLHQPLQDVFAAVRRYVNAFLETLPCGAEGLYGVTLSTSGTVEYRTGRLRYSAHSPEWGVNIPISDFLRDVVGEKPVILVENAGKTTGRSVLLSRAELRSSRVLTLFTSWGISGCLLQNGRPLNGRNSLIGEIGHMTVEPSDTEVCGCGMKGCLERLVSLKRVRQMMKTSPPAKESPLYGLEESVSFSQIFSASSAQDRDARTLVRYLAECFASALHNICLIYNPDYVVFQGDFGQADLYFDECLKMALGDFRYYPQEGAFETIYDARGLFELDAQGGWFMLNEYYFNTVELYMDVL